MASSHWPVLINLLVDEDINLLVILKTIFHIYSAVAAETNYYFTYHYIRSKEEERKAPALQNKLGKI